MIVSVDSFETGGTRSDWERDYALFAVVIVAGMMGPWQLTDVISFWPLHWFAAIYLGYRMGRWFGFAAGLLTCLPWYLSQHVVFLQSLTDYGHSISFQDLVVAGILGWVSGWLR